MVPEQTILTLDTILVPEQLSASPGDPQTQWLLLAD